MIKLFLRGGWPMWPLLLCSIVSLAIVIDRFWYFFVRIRGNDEQLFQGALSALKRDRPLEAMEVVRRRKSPTASILAAAISNYDEPNDVVEESVELAGRLEVHRMEKGLPMLNGIGVLSQLLGLLGTATGVMTTFNIIGNLAGVTTPSDMAPGIAMDLLTTIFGLSIAVPTMAFHLIFAHQVEERKLIMSTQATALLRVMGKRGERA